MEIVARVLLFIAAALFGYGVVDGDGTLVFVAIPVALLSAAVDKLADRRRGDDEAAAVRASKPDRRREVTVAVVAVVVSAVVGFGLGALDAPAWLVLVILAAIVALCCTGPVQRWTRGGTTA